MSVGAITVLEKIKVKNVIIGKQFKNSKNFQDFINIVNRKNIKIHEVEAGQRIKIQKDLHLDIIFPDSSHIIDDNVLNNNSLVCKLTYKEFSMLFTGDIEEKAEKVILEKYKYNLGILRSDVLKVAHHGSKTSSTEEFLTSVKPKVTLIGVGKDNNFGHPSMDILERLEQIRE